MTVDDERVDLTIRQKADHKEYSSSVIDVQMKCTSQDVIYRDGLHWSLPADHYRDLADTRSYVHKILVVLHVPKQPGEWLKHGTDYLQLRHTAYWTCLEGEPATTSESKTVILPKENVFDVAQLLGMLKRTGDGGRP